MNVFFYGLVRTRMCSNASTASVWLLGKLLVAAWWAIFALNASRLWLALVKMTVVRYRDVARRSPRAVRIRVLEQRLDWCRERLEDDACSSAEWTAFRNLESFFAREYYRELIDLTAEETGSGPRRALPLP